MDNEVDITLSVSRKQLLQIKAILYIANQTLMNVANGDAISRQHAKDILFRLHTELDAVLEGSEKLVEAKTKLMANKTKARALAEEMDDEWDEPKNYFFALRLSEEAYELYLCQKWSWFNYNETFPWCAIYSENDVIRAAVVGPEDGPEDADSGMYWYEGGVEKMEAHRKLLVDLGFEEKPEILTALRNNVGLEVEPEADDNMNWYLN